MLSGFATCISAFQNVMIWLMFPAAEMQAAMDAAPRRGDEPAWALWMLHNFQWIFAGFFVVCATTLAASIGLLMRHNWARLVFIALLGLGIAWNVGAIVLAGLMFSGAFGGAWAVPEAQQAQFGAMMYAFMGFNLLFVLALVALFAWIIKRLSAPDIRREFGVA